MPSVTSYIPDKIYKVFQEKCMKENTKASKRIFDLVKKDIGYVEPTTPVAKTESVV